MFSKPRPEASDANGRGSRVRVAVVWSNRSEEGQNSTAVRGIHGKFTVAIIFSAWNDS